MLNVYIRHAHDCDHRDDMGRRRCRCPKWLRGVLPNGRSLRTSTKRRSPLKRSLLCNHPTLT